MRKLQLVMASASQIQSYIFASNKLREHVGASHLVAQATGAWALEAVQKVAARSNVLSQDGLLLGGEFAIERESGDAAEVIYSGGGNVEVLFTSADAAGRFVRRLSERLLCEAPGLRVVFGRAEFDWDEDRSIEAAAKSARKDVEAAKRAPTSGGGAMLGLGVTAACVATGLPAVARDEEGKPTSAESMARLAAFEAADRMLRDTFQRELGEYLFPYDLDKLGRSRGEDSHVAVLHADGNGFGALRQKMLAGFADNRDYVSRARRFSAAVRDISRAALAHTLDVLCRRITRDENTGWRSISHAVEGRTIRIELRSAGGGRDFLPVRPIIYGGDDLTLVCDGRIALALAEEYLHQFEAESGKALRSHGIADPQQLTACGGVAIVRSHFPFARAYELAEDLCGEAKKRRAEVQKDVNSAEPGSFLDWHIAMSGLIGDLDEIRRREYQVRGRDGKERLQMTLRPVAVSGPEQVRTWETVQKGIDAFQRKWADHRNKVKALRESLRGGPLEVERFVRVYQGGAGDKRPVLPMASTLPGAAATSGFVAGRCVYYDAVELMDMYVPLYETQSSFADEAVEESEVKK